MVRTVETFGDFRFITEDAEYSGAEARLEFNNQDSQYYYFLTAEGGDSFSTVGGDGVVWVTGPAFSEDRHRVQILATANGGIGFGSNAGGDAEIRFFEMDFSTPTLHLGATVSAGISQDGTQAGSASIAITDNLIAGDNDGSSFVFSLQNTPPLDAPSSTTFVFADNTMLGGDGRDTWTIMYNGTTPDLNTISENQMIFGAGDDVFMIWGLTTDAPELSLNQFDGGDGFDIFLFKDIDGITVDLFQDGFRNFEQVEGSDFADSIIADDLDNHIYGWGGNDELDGEFGDDLLVGGEGDDTMDGGVGIDTASFIDSAAGVDVDLLLFTSTGNGEDELHNIENIIGSSHDDVILGDAVDNRLEGRDGNDALDGHHGNDVLLGGLGDDSLDGDVGSDWADYSDLDDLLSTVGVIVSLGLVGEQDTGLGGIDTLISIENLRGSQDDDLLTGTAASNWIIGEAGDDIIEGLGGADTLEGHGGDDTLFGGDDADTLSGGLGFDVLTGGAGADTFGFYALSLAGDTIMDFAVEDRVLISDLAFEDFTFAMSGNTLIYAGVSLVNDLFIVGGSASFATPLSGYFVAQEAVLGSVELLFIPDAVRNDFDGDGRSDILWRSDSGGFSNWLGQANGSFANNDDNAFASVATSWQIAGNGDFNRDGFADVLWRSDSGQVSNWLGQADGGFTNNDSNALTSAPTNWHVVGTGDFNGDGYDDILWRSDSGQLSNWLAQPNGSFANNDANALTSAPTNWHVVGTGDFNGDHIDDILWRSDAGELSNWLGQDDGSFVNNDANAFSSVPTNWHVVGTGDFNGDDYADILWRSSTGELSNWLGTTNGGFVNNDANAFTAAPTNWHVVAVGDYNGDGFSDILWRSDSGEISNWLGSASGGFTNNDANAYSSVPTIWQTQPEDPWI